MIKKQYLKSKPSCKVTFTLPTKAVNNQAEVRVVGDFNNWNWDTGTIMKANKEEYKAVVELATGGDYQFRYVMANGEWENDWAADAYVPSPYFGTDNSVVTIEAVTNVKEAIAPKAKTTLKAKPAPAAKKKASKATKAPKTIKADNLKVIEGVGPKIEKLLNEKGINTFAALAKAKQSLLKEVLADAGNRFKMHDPTTWPEQAKLAAKGDTDKLAKLQAELKGGKR